MGKPDHYMPTVRKTARVRGEDGGGPGVLVEDRRGPGARERKTEVWGAARRQGSKGGGVQGERVLVPTRHGRQDYVVIY